MPSKTALKEDKLYKVLSESFTTDGKINVWTDWESQIIQMIAAKQYSPSQYFDNFIGFLTSKTNDHAARLRIAGCKDEGALFKLFSEDEKDSSKVSGRKQFGLDIADRKVRLLYDAGRMMLLAQAAAEQKQLKDSFISREARDALEDMPIAEKIDFAKKRQDALAGITIELNLQIKTFLEKKRNEIAHNQIILIRVQALLRRANEKLSHESNIGKLVSLKARMAMYINKLEKIEREINSSVTALRPDSIAAVFKDSHLPYFTEEEINAEVDKLTKQSDGYQKYIDSLGELISPKNDSTLRFGDLNAWVSQAKTIKESFSSVVRQQGTTFFGSLPEHWANLNTAIQAYNPDVVATILDAKDKAKAETNIGMYAKAQGIVASNQSGWTGERKKPAPLHFQVVDEKDHLVTRKGEKHMEVTEHAFVSISQKTQEATAANKLSDRIAATLHSAKTMKEHCNAKIKHQLEQKRHAERQAEIVQALEKQRPATPTPPSPSSTAVTPINERDFKPIDSPENRFTLATAPHSGSAPSLLVLAQNGGAGPASPGVGALSIPPLLDGRNSPSNDRSISTPHVSPKTPKRESESEGGFINWMASKSKDVGLGWKLLSCVLVLPMLFWPIAYGCERYVENKTKNAKSASAPASPTVASRSPESSVIGASTAKMGKGMGGNIEKLRKGSYDEKIMKTAKESLRSIVNDQPPKDPKNPKIKLSQGIIRVAGARYKTIERPYMDNGYQLAFSVDTGKIYIRKDDNVWPLPEVVVKELLQPVKEGGVHVAFEFDKDPVMIEGRLAIRTVKSVQENGPIAIRADDNGNGRVYQYNKTGETLLINGAEANKVIEAKLKGIAALTYPGSYARALPRAIGGAADMKHVRPEAVVPRSV